MDFKFWKKQPPAPTQPPPQWGIREATIGSLPRGWIYRASGRLKFAGRGWQYELSATQHNAELLSTLGYQSGPHNADALSRILAAERRPSNIALYRKIYFETPNCFIRIALVPVVRTPASRTTILIATPARIQQNGWDTKSLIQKIMRAIAIKLEIMDAALFDTLKTPTTTFAKVSQITFQDALRRDDSRTTEFYLVAIAAAFQDAVKPK